MPKNIVVCADGTGNVGGTEKETNVFKLYRLLEETQAENAYYDQGLGTDRMPLLGKAFGVGISKNIRDCYEFLVDHYEYGDTVFLFGFSRGAFTVRSLGGLISYCGLVKRRYRSLTTQAYKLYKADRKNPEATRAFKKAFGRQVHIGFVGVWDTVGALGLGLPLRWLGDLNPFRHKFHNTTLSKHVPSAYQALSVDDERRAFHPTLWSEPAVEGQTIEQAWFPGMHSDVGGGYSNHDLSDIALEWIMQKAENCGLRFISGWEEALNPSATGIKMENSRSGWGRLFAREVRYIQRISDRYGIETALIHESVMERQDTPACNYAPINLPREFRTVQNQPVPEPRPG